MNEDQPPQPLPPDDSVTPPASPPPLANGVFLSNMTSNQWAMSLHLSQLTNLVIPGLGIVAPILIWQLQKARFPELDRHGKMVTNWLICLLIFVIAGFVASIATCGVGTILFVPVVIAGIVFPIIGGIQANKGVFWKYPLTFSFIK